ncbi:MAG: hypothetical protein ACOYNS_14150, partial [Bacteroidota bacterium]
MITSSSPSGSPSSSAPPIKNQLAGSPQIPLAVDWNTPPVPLSGDPDDVPIANSPNSVIPSNVAEPNDARAADPTRL